ncbi:MAG: DUF4234 domain-containing protein [Prolixibacteraceae bacterium]|nr:DUF4234 domain-containing protein [Prolixibacteraceae bacterium]
MNQEVLRIERSVRERNETDKVLINYWLYLFLLSWITFGIMAIVLFFQRISRIDKFINRKKDYYDGLIIYSEQIAKEKGKYEELSTQINNLRDVYEHDFLKNNKKINAGLSLLLIIITLGIWGLIVMYKLNKAWDNLQRSEQKFYDELNPILTKLELTKYPVNFRIKTNKKRSFILYLILTIITCGIWGIVWDYKIHTDADNLYPEIHTAEDSVLGMIKK